MEELTPNNAHSCRAKFQMDCIWHMFWFTMSRTKTRQTAINKSERRDSKIDTRLKQSNWVIFLVLKWPVCSSRIHRSVEKTSVCSLAIGILEIECAHVFSVSYQCDFLRHLICVFVFIRSVRRVSKYVIRKSCNVFFTFKYSLSHRVALL